MAWAVLVVSGVLEAVWATALGASEGFKRKGATALFLAALVLSMAGLGYAMITLPTGTAYAVWVGIGTILTVTIASIRTKTKPSTAHIVLLLVLIGSVVGLKAVS